MAINNPKWNPKWNSNNKEVKEKIYTKKLMKELFHLWHILIKFKWMQIQ
jgi:hypothetical protein